MPVGAAFNVEGRENQRMRINWKLRLKNRATLSTLIGLVAAIIYQILGWFGIIPKVPITDLLDAVSVILEALALLGIIVDPTTQGVSDSERAMQYVIPNKPEVPAGYFENAIREGGEDDG